jgi:two-component system, chemotaxis family, chemotaxis protein CheY
MIRILTIDDDYTSRTQTKALLSTLGDCDSAPNGRVGLDLFQLAHAERHPYGLVVLDVDMPEMSGLEVLKALREWEVQTDNFRQGRATKVLMLSALSDGRTVMSSYTGGCEAYVVKPLSPAKLTKALSEVGIATES